MQELNLTRRSSLKAVGAIGAAAMLSGVAEATAAEPPKQPTDIRKQIFAKVWKTTLIDTHEHLVEESMRLRTKGGRGLDDWSRVLMTYLSADLISAGMPKEVHKQIFRNGPSPVEKWRLLAPYWPLVKNTGYALAARLSFRELFGVDELSEATVEKAQAGYEKLRRPGFYRHILHDICNVESCQVNAMGEMLYESEQPTLLMQDIRLTMMFATLDMKKCAEPTGITPTNLADWHKIIDWWFTKYGRYLVAGKSNDAYSREMNYEQVRAESVEAPFKKWLDKKPLSPREMKGIQDHLFWYCIAKCKENNLPVKFHTGYHAGNDRMRLSVYRDNASSLCDICRADHDTSFVAFHINYPFYDELLAVAKHYTNLYVDMCWAWSINPIAAKDFLKKYLVSAPANKILTFGGDTDAVEHVVGYSIQARHGIATALSELVDEGWLKLDDALALTDPIMHGNARKLYNLDEKTKALARAPWL